MAEHGKVEQIELPERKILVSEPIGGSYDDGDFAVAAEFSLRLKNVFGLYDNFGSRISVENIKQRDFEHYDCFFAYGRDESEEFDESLPKGKYLRAFNIGKVYLNGNDQEQFLLKMLLTVLLFIKILSFA